MYYNGSSYPKGRLNIMQNILIRAGSYIAIIILGIVLRRIGFF